MPNYNTDRARPVQAELALRHICSAMEGLSPVADNARIVHRTVSAELLRVGCSVINEYPMPYMGRSSPRKGRIDIYASLMGVEVAIELDARRPRQMSLIKMNSFNGLRICGLRGVSGNCPDGIDAMVSIPVMMR